MILSSEHDVSQPMLLCNLQPCVSSVGRWVPKHNCCVLFKWSFYYGCVVRCLSRAHVIYMFQIRSSRLIYLRSIISVQQFNSSTYTMWYDIIVHKIECKTNSTTVKGSIEKDPLIVVSKQRLKICTNNSIWCLSRQYHFLLLLSERLPLDIVFPPLSESVH